MPDPLAERIKDAEERLRQSIAQRIERNRTSLAQLQHEHHIFETAFSPVGTAPVLDSSSVKTGCITTHTSSSGTASVPIEPQEASCGASGSTSNKSSVAATAAVAEATLSAHAHDGSRSTTAIKNVPIASEQSVPHQPQRPTAMLPVEAESVPEAVSGESTIDISTPSSSSALLLRMTVEIGDGRMGEVRVRKGDRPEELARTFCEQHGLGDRAAVLLTQHIATNLAEVLVHHVEPVRESVAGPSAAPGARSSVSAASSACPSAASGGCLSFGASRGYLAPTTASKASEYGSQAAAETAAARGVATTRASSRPRVKPAARLRAHSAPRPRCLSVGAGSDRGGSCNSKSDVAPGSEGREGEPTINERSRRLIEQRGDRGNVFSRLHQENEDIKQRRAQLKSVLADEEMSEVLSAPVMMSQTSRKLLQLRGYDDANSIGERLHADGLRSKAKRIAASKAAEALLDPEATFRPKLSRSSVVFSSSHVADPWRLAGQAATDRTSSYSERSRGAKGGGQPSIWEVQYMEAEQRRAERQLLQQLYAVDQQRECSHRPTVTRSSREIDALRRKRSASATARLVRTKETSSATDGVGAQQQQWDEEEARHVLPPRVEAPRSGHSIHDSLFADAKEKRRVLLQREAEHDAKIEEKARTWSARHLDPGAFNRLCYAHRQKEVELQALRDYLTSHEDPTSGRPLFKPHITRGPKRDGTGTTSACKGSTASDAWEAASERSAAAMTDAADGGLSATAQADGNTTSCEATPMLDAPSAASSSRCAVGLKAHLRGDSRLISGEALHSHRVKHRRSRETLREQAREQIAHDHQMPTMGAFTTGESEHIVKSMREKRITELFHTIDVNGEGVLDGKVLIAALPRMPPDVSAALRPISSTYEHEFLSLSDFKDLVARALEQTAPNGPRYNLLPDRGTTSIYANAKAQQLREQQAECRFKPVVDAKSAKLAASRRDSSRGIVEQLIDAQAEYAARRMVAQRAAISQVEAECPFRPSILIKPGSATSSEPKTQRQQQQQTVEAAAAQPRPRSRSESNPRPPMPSSEELELLQHCTFRPRINHFAGVDRRVDTGDPHNDEALMKAFHLSYVPRKHSKNPTGYSQLSSTGYPDHTKVGAVSAMAKAALAEVKIAASAGGECRQSVGPHSACWGAYAASQPRELHSSLSEQDLARTLQGEIEQEVAHLSDLELPTAAAIASSGNQS